LAYVINSVSIGCCLQQFVCNF